MILKASPDKDGQEILSVINFSNRLAFKKIIPEEYFTEPVLTQEKLIEEFIEISFYVYKSQGRIVGVIGLRSETSEEGIIRWVYIHPDYQRKGIGTALLIFLEQKAKNIGIKRLRLRTEEKAIWALKFYHKMGYSITEKIEVPWGFNVMLEKKINEDSC